MELKIGRLGRKLREHSGNAYKSLPRQMRDVFELLVRGHLHPSEYFHYGLSRKGVHLAEAATYMSNRFHWESHLSRLNDPRWHHLMDNKWLFHLHFRNLVPLPRFLGIYHPVQGTTWDGKHLRTVTDVDALLTREAIGSFVLKPAWGIQGAGVIVVDDVVRSWSGMEFVLRDGRRVAAETTLPTPEDANLRNQGFLLEERLVQHEELREIAPYAACTVRVVTLVGVESTTVQVACVRFGAKGAMVDNFSRGGYCVSVDVQTGEMGKGRRKSGRGAQLETRHADSGVEFTGRRVPLWDDVVAVCMKAAEATPGLRSIGWDVVVTPDGPVLIEGNRDWGIMMCQAVGGGFLRPAVVSELKALGVSVDPHRLPGLNLRRAVSSLTGSWSRSGR